MKINNFRGELTDISAKKEALVEIGALFEPSTKAAAVTYPGRDRVSNATT